MKPESLKSKSLSLIYVRLPVIVNGTSQDPYSATLAAPSVAMDIELDRQLDGCKEHLCKLGVGVYLAEEDDCYPGILAIMQVCRENRIQLFIIPVAEQSLTAFRQEDDRLRTFLDEQDRGLRLAQFPLP
jgi:hypothetical protein